MHIEHAHSITMIVKPLYNTQNNYNLCIYSFIQSPSSPSIILQQEWTVIFDKSNVDNKSPHISSTPTHTHIPLYYSHNLILNSISCDLPPPFRINHKNTVLKIPPELLSWSISKSIALPMNSTASSSVMNQNGSLWLDDFDISSMEKFWKWKSPSRYMGIYPTMTLHGILYIITTWTLDLFFPTLATGIRSLKFYIAFASLYHTLYVLFTFNFNCNEIWCR